MTKSLRRRARKTGRYLGMITEDKGLVPPRRKQVEIENEAVSSSVEKGRISVPEPKVGQVREYGLSAFISGHCTDMIENLEASGAEDVEPCACDGILSSSQPISAEIYTGGFRRQLSVTDIGHRRAVTKNPYRFYEESGEKQGRDTGLHEEVCRCRRKCAFDGTDILSSSAKWISPE